VPFTELFIGPGRTSAGPDELLVAVEVPAVADTLRAGSAYVRLEYRRQMEIAVVGAAVSVTLDSSGRVDSAQVAMTALAPTVRRVPEAEALLIGTEGDRDAATAAGEAVARAAKPISDVRASEEYRRAMAAVVAQRAVRAAVARAAGAVVAIPASDSTFGGDRS
jgi:CO/xanthine dehydrogenase FAD-binding subunit